MILLSFVIPCLTRDPVLLKIYISLWNWIPHQVRDDTKQYPQSYFIV